MEVTDPEYVSIYIRSLPKRKWSSQKAAVELMQVEYSYRHEKFSVAHERLSKRHLYPEDGARALRGRARDIITPGRIIVRCVRHRLAILKLLRQHNVISAAGTVPTRTKWRFTSHEQARHATAPQKKTFAL